MRTRIIWRGARCAGARVQHHIREKVRVSVVHVMEEGKQLSILLLELIIGLLQCESLLFPK
jgi:hypothetical protein